MGESFRILSYRFSVDCQPKQQAEVIKYCIEDERILTISKTTIVGTYDCDTRLDLEIPHCFQQERIDYLPNRSDRPDSPDCYIEIFGRVY